MLSTVVTLDPQALVIQDPLPPKKEDKQENQT